MPDGRTIRVPVLRRVPVNIKALRDVIEQPYYDTVRVSHGEQTIYRLFQEIVGQGTSAIKGSGSKTKLDTNMPETGRFPKGYAAQINGIGVEIVAEYDGTALTFPSISSVQNFAMNTLLRLTIGDKEYALAPVLFYPAGTGLNSANASLATLGMPQKVNLKKLAIPHKISEGRNFAVELDNTVGNPYNFGGTGRALIVRVYLDCIVWRIVQ
jgi:hypothetical protein